MEFRLLGPFEVVADGAPVNLGGRQRRTLLAILVVHVGDSVTTDRIIDELWGESPPSAARKSVQSHVAHLRRNLNVKDEVLASADDGYVVQADRDDIDSIRFQDLLTKSRQIREEDPLHAVAILERALNLFRGAPLAGLADDAFSLRLEASRLEELRLGAIEDRLEALLKADDVSSVVVEAEGLVAEHPLRERLWGSLMLGLYRSGRQAEALRAYSRARQVLSQELGIEPSSSLQRLEQQILEHAEALTARPQDIVAVKAKPVVRNPYKGLRAFDEADSADFFGRQELVRRLRDRVESRTSNHLTVLAGPSGTGKSSVVRAGLLPALRESDVPVGVMLPGEDPFRALQNTLGEVTGEDPRRLTKALLAGGALDPLVIAVDQLEEIFAAVTSRESANHLLELMSSPANGIHWVATVRADFLDRLLTHPRFAPLMDESVLLVPTLQDHEVRAATTGPAQRVGVEVEPELVAAVVADVRARPSSLPLMQYALTDLFERRKGDTLTVADYEGAGGIAGALVRRAEDLYSSLSPQGQALARHFFLELVTITDEGGATRRRVETETMIGPEGASAVRSVIERFGSVRLIVFDQHPETGAPTVEIAHETLIAEWPRLAAWVNDARDDLRMRDRVSTAALEWEESGRDSDFLVTGARLAEMEAWLEDTGAAPTRSGLELIDASRAREDSERRRRATRRRLVGTVLAVATVLSLALAFIARNQANTATLRELAAASRANLDTDPELSLLLALEAIERTTGRVIPEVEEALHQAVQTHRAGMTRPSEGIAFFSPDGAKFLGGFGNDVQVFNSRTGELTMTLVGHSDRVFNGVWSADGTVIATNSLDGTTKVWNAVSGELLWSIDVGSIPVSIAISADSELLATSYGFFSDNLEHCAECLVRVWSLTEQELVRQKSLEGPLGINFGPGGLLAVANAEGNTIEVFDPLSGNDMASVEVGYAGDVAWDPGGRFLAAVGDQDVYLLRTDTWEVTHRLIGLEGEVGGIDVSPDGQLVAAGDIDGTVMLWDPTSARPVLTLRGQRASVFNIAFSPDGGRLASSAEDGTVSIWDLTEEATAEGLRLNAHGGDIDFSPDGIHLVAAAFGAGVWETENGTQELDLEGHEDLILRTQFSADGTRIVTTSFDGTAGVWDSNTGARLHLLEHGGVVGGASFSPDGSHLATVDEFNIHIWDPDSGQRISVIETSHTTNRPDRPGVFDVEYSPDGRWLATSGGDGWVRMWDGANGTSIWEAQAHTGSLDPGSRQIDFSPDGSIVVSIGFDGAMHLWDADSGERIRSLETGAGGELLAVDFSPNGTRVAAAGRDGLVSVYDVDGTRKVTVGETPADVFAVEFSPDGEYLFVSSEDDIVRSFALDVHSLADIAVSRLSRWWTVEECIRLLHSEVCPEPPDGLSELSIEGG